jgi:hypothetical protein
MTSGASGARLVAAAAVAVAASVALAEDPPKPAAPAKLALHLAADKTYLYKFSETVHAWSATDRGGKTDQHSEANWELEIKLVEAKPDGGAVVSLVVTKVSGWYQNLELKEKQQFGSEAVGYVGGETRVTLSPTARVLEVTGRIADVTAKDKKEPDRAAEARRAAVERFFQTLPAAPPRTGTAWEDSRLLAPDMVQSGQHLEGDVPEKATVKKAAADAVTVTLAAKGKKTIAKRKPGSTPDPNPKKNGTLAPQLETWSLAGECEISAETGLAQTRTGHAEATTYEDLWAMKPPTILDCACEYDFKLEAAGVR